MPHAQEGRRSFKYRPFITCDDPRGVVECGTIRKHKEEQQSHRRKQKNLNSVVVKGGLDVGESLSMFSRLHQSSDCISRSANKHLKMKTEIIEDPGSRGSSTDAFEKIKRMIGNGGVDGKNMFSDPSSEEACDDTSSSQSSIVHSSNLVSPDSLLSSTASKKKNDDRWKSGWKRRTLDQMIDVLKFRGNHKSLKGYLDMKPSRFSCLDTGNPIIPKPKGKVDEELILNMRIRTNPLAETDEFGNLKFNQKVVSGSRRKGEREKMPKYDNHLQHLDGGKLPISKVKSSRGDTNTKINMLQTLLIQNAEEYGVDEIEKVNNIGEREFLLPLEDSTGLTEDASQIEITDYVDDDLSSPSETPMIYPNERNTNTKLHDKESQCSTSDTSDIEEEDNYVCVTSTLSTNENKLKQLLLSSPSFIDRVEELFDLKGGPFKDLLNDIDHNDLSAKMILDTANELVELHGLECSKACLPLPLTHKMSLVSCYYTCLDQLLDEVCNGIEALRFYIKDEEDGYAPDNLLLLAKGDLRNGKMVSGLWDVGWRNARSADEIEEITRGVDELVLDELIQEIVVDLTL